MGSWWNLYFYLHLNLSEYKWMYLYGLRCAFLCLHFISSLICKTLDHDGPLQLHIERIFHLEVSSSRAYECRTLSQGSEPQTEDEKGTLMVSTWLTGRKPFLELGKPLLESSYFLIRDVACRSVCILKGEKNPEFVLCVWSFHFCLVNIYF